MSRLTPRLRLLVAVFAAQALLLVLIPVLQGARIAGGTHVLVAVTPVDPLDLARGAYVDLRYEFEELPVQDYGGTDAYVLLEEPASGSAAWDVERIATRPDDDADAFIRLPLDGDGRIDTSSISSWYADADSALEMERQLARGGALAELSLDEDGTPQLVDVVER